MLSRLRIKENLWGYLFILPWLIGFILLWGGPVVSSFIISLYNWTILDPPKWLGLKNYQRLITDQLFWQSLKVTGIYIIIVVPALLFLSLFAAMLLNNKLRGVRLFRTIYYTPVVVSGVVLAVAWLWLLNPNYGFVNYFLRTVFGIQGPRWLNSSFWALPSVIVVSLWRIGTTMVIFLAGIQEIPAQLYEAADIDGARWTAKFRYITMPMLSPIILFNVFMLIIESFQVFTPVYVMTEGGPHYATLMYVLYLYNNAFGFLKMGYASALAWVFFMIMMVFTIILLKSSNRWVFYLGGEK
ncbi:MAG: sugar ABC transporter permease [Candidatus Atribacteria bacterium]|nr:sugar ABC transporter permease [Candidatus Atribacteria bacterium]